MTEFRAPLKATPGYGVISIDRAQVIRSVARKIHESVERNAVKLREQDAMWKYETRESLVFVVEKLGHRRYRATSATEVGGPGNGQVWAEARTIDGLMPELRYTLGVHYRDRKLCRDYDEARDRADRADIYLDRSLALGSKGELTG